MTLIESARKEGIELFHIGIILKNEEKVLLLERPMRMDHVGIFELPSSAIKQEEHLSQGLIRTVMEKTGLELDQIHTYLLHHDFEKGDQKGRTFIFIATPKNPYNVEVKAHIGFAWVSPEDAPSYPISDQLRETLSTYLKWLS